MPTAAWRNRLSVVAEEKPGGCALRATAATEDILPT